MKSFYELYKKNCKEKEVIIKGRYQISNKLMILIKKQFLLNFIKAVKNVPVGLWNDIKDKKIMFILSLFFKKKEYYEKENWS